MTAVSRTTRSTPVGPALTEEDIRAASVAHDHLPTYSYPAASAVAPFNPTLKQTLNMLTDGPALTEEHIRAASVGHDHLPTYSYPTASAVSPFNLTLKPTLHMLTDQDHKSIEVITYSYQHRPHQIDCSELNAVHVGLCGSGIHHLVATATGANLALTAQRAHGRALASHAYRGRSESLQRS